MIEPFDEGLEYVCETDTNSWPTVGGKPKVFNTKEEAQKIFKFRLTNNNTFVFLAIIKGNNHWSSGLLKMSKNTSFSVLGSYPG